MPTTTVHLTTITDLSGQVWSNAVVSYAINGNGPFFLSDGSDLPAQYLKPQSITLDGNGNGTFVVEDSANIIPVNTRWKVTLNPDASAQGVTFILLLTGASTNISSIINVGLAGITVDAARVPTAYNDSEITGPIETGELYFNTGADMGLRVFDFGVWKPLAGGGGSGTPGGPNGAVQFNNVGDFGGDSNFVYVPDTGSGAALALNATVELIGEVSVQGLLSVVGGLDVDGTFTAADGNFVSLEAARALIAKVNFYSSDTLQFPGLPAIHTPDLSGNTISIDGDTILLGVGGTVNGTVFGDGTGTGTQVASIDAAGNGTFAGNIRVGPTSFFKSNGDLACAINGNVQMAWAGSGAYSNITINGNNLNGTRMGFVGAPSDPTLYIDSPPNGQFMFRSNNLAIATINFNGDAHFFGALTAATKAFQIFYPLTKTTKDPNLTLNHGCLEGPEFGVFYRGENETTAGVVEIFLPEYFEPLTADENRSVLLTQQFNGDSTAFAVLMATPVVAGKFTVYSSSPNIKFWWEVKAVRTDVPPLVVIAPYVPPVYPPEI